MHSAGTRLNAVFTFLTSVLGVVVALLAVSTILFSHEAPVEATLNTIHRFERDRYTGDDRAVISLDIKANLSSVFNWNVKQLFVYVTAEYVTDKNVVNQVVVWDYIVQSRDQADLSFKGVPNKYPLIDQGTGLKNNKIKFTVSYNVIPVSGLMFTLSGTPKSTVFASKYF